MRALFTICLFLFSFSAFAQEAPGCVCDLSDEAGQCLQTYCVHPGKSADVVYYFHGAGSSEGNWGEDAYYPAQIRAYWQEKGLPPPTVVAVSYGRTWLLAPKNSSSQSGLFEDFENRLRPLIEAGLGETPARRMVIGESMGAFNSLQLALRTPNYAKAAILCGVMHETLSPFSTEEELTEAIKASIAYRARGEEDVTPMLQRIQGALKLARDYYPTREEWMPFDPLALAASTTSPTSFYIASGLHDVFASYEGNEKLAKILASKNIPVDWRPQWGGHCAIDIPSVARFLVE
jgi:pimeloyl-ACP methyl ester carboxylesterase